MTGTNAASITLIHKDDKFHVSPVPLPFKPGTVMNALVLGGRNK